MSTIDNKLQEHNENVAAHTNLLSMIGAVNNLETEEKSSAVLAINELLLILQAISNALDVANRNNAAGKISSKVASLASSISNLATAIKNKNTAFPIGSALGLYAGYINAISTGRDLNIHFGVTAPADISSLWIKRAMTPGRIQILTSTPEILTKNAIAIIAGSNTTPHSVRLLNTVTHGIDMQVQNVYYGNADNLPVRITSAIYTGEEWKEIN